MNAGQTIVAFFAGLIAVIAVLAALAPHEMTKPVSLSTVPAGICGDQSPAISVTLVDDAGYQQYKIVCQLGVTLLYSR